MIPLKGFRTFEDKRRELLRHGYSEIEPKGLPDESELIRNKKVSKKGKISFTIKYTITGCGADPETGIKSYRREILGSGSETIKEGGSDRENDVEKRAKDRLRKLRDVDGTDFEESKNLRKKEVESLVEDYLEKCKQDELDNGADIEQTNVQKKLSAKRSTMEYLLRYCEQKGIITFNELKGEISGYRMFLAYTKKKRYDLNDRDTIRSEDLLTLNMADKCLSGAKDFAKWCAKEDRNLDISNFSEITPFKKSKEIKEIFRNRSTVSKKRELKDEEVIKIIEQATQPIAGRFAVGAITGLRPKKISTMTWKEVDFQKKVLDLIWYEKVEFKEKIVENSMKTKGEKRLVFPMTDELFKILKIQKIAMEEINSYYDINSPFVFPIITRKPSMGHSYNDDTNKNNALARYCKDSGVNPKDVTSYSFRTTFNNRCRDLPNRNYQKSRKKHIEDFRFTEPEVQYLMGHALSDSIKALHYDHITDEFVDMLREKLNQIPYGFNLQELVDKFQQVSIPLELREIIKNRFEKENC